MLQLDVAAVFQDLGYIGRNKARLHIPHQFVAPQSQPQDVAPAEPKPKLKPKPAAQSMNVSTNVFVARI